MARRFDDALSQYLAVGSTPVTAPPLTISAWVYIDDLTNDQVVLSIYYDSDNYHLLFVDGGGTNEARAYTEAGGSSTYAETSTEVTENAWYHLCGVWASTTSRSVWIDAAGKDTDTTSRTPTPATTIEIGRYMTGSLPLSGRVAEPTIWNAALTDYEVAMLPHNPPWKIRPSNLVAYWPFRQTHTWDRDLSGRGYHLTPYNAPTWAPHPPQARKYWLARDLRLWRKLAKAPAAAVGQPMSLRSIDVPHTRKWTPRIV